MTFMPRSGYGQSSPIRRKRHGWSRWTASLSATPSRGGVDYPPATEVWTLNADNWAKNADTYRAEWRELFGKQ